ncbi:MAG TPA: CoA transferase [Acidimicrobiales bacterium]|nr:CoA transferase [Acidimicrobiales bacterium]
MPGPMEGVKVVEVGQWVAGPAAAAVLGDWGADVVKIEPPEGDPFRGLLSALGAGDTSPPFELDNRNKRSVALNLALEEGREIAGRLVDGADVLVTNARPAALARAGLDFATVAERNPRLVYAHVTGYGLNGEDSDRAAYDVGAFWSRAGVAASLTPDGSPLPYQRGGMGDHMAGLAAAGAVSAALFARERTGEGQLVSVSLLRIGMYMIGWDISMSLRMGFPTVPMTVAAPPNPLITAYQAGDGKRFWMLGLQADRHWPDVLRAVERPEWAEDERFSSIMARFQHSAELVSELNAIFATRPLADWAPIFDREDVWWAPVQHAHETVDDPQARAAGGFVAVPVEGGDPVDMVATPVDFGGTPWAPRSMPPEFAQHTEEVLLELGHDWDRIIELKELGAIP